MEKERFMTAQEIKRLAADKFQASLDKHLEDNIHLFDFVMDMIKEKALKGAMGFRLEKDSFSAEVNYHTIVGFRWKFKALGFRFEPQWKLEKEWIEISWSLNE